MTFWLTFYRGEATPILETTPTESDDARSIAVELADGRASSTLSALLALESYGVALACGALYQHAFNAGQRSRRSPTA